MPRDLLSEIAGEEPRKKAGRNLLAEIGAGADQGPALSVEPAVRPQASQEPLVPRLVKKAGRTLGATAETAYSLGEGAIVWPISKAAGFAGMVKSGKTPKEWEEKTASFLTHRPILKETEDTMQVVGKGFEIAETPQRMAEKQLEEWGYPRIAYATKFLGDLVMFKFISARTAKAKAKILKESVKESKAVIPDKEKFFAEIDQLEKAEFSEKLDATKIRLKAAHESRIKAEPWKAEGPKSAKESAGAFEAELSQNASLKARDAIRSSLKAKEEKSRYWHKDAKSAEESARIFEAELRKSQSPEARVQLKKRLQAETDIDMIREKGTLPDEPTILDVKAEKPRDLLAEIEKPAEEGIRLVSKPEAKFTPKERAEMLTGQKVVLRKRETPEAGSWETPVSPREPIVEYENVGPFKSKAAALTVRRQTKKVDLSKYYPIQKGEKWYLRKDRQPVGAELNPREAPERVALVEKPVPPVEAPAKGKEAWEMTRNEYYSKQKRLKPIQTEKAKFARERELEDFGERVTDKYPTFGMTDQEVSAWAANIRKTAIKEYNEAEKNLRSTGKTGKETFMGVEVSTPAEVLAGLKKELNESIENADRILEIHKRDKALLFVDGKGWMNPDVVEAHRNNVQQALSEGKPVPAEVLKDYPDLQPKAKEAQKAETQTEPKPEKPSPRPEAGARKLPDSSPSGATVDFLGFQQMYDRLATWNANRKAAKDQPRLTKKKPEEVENLKKGNVIKQRTWKSAKTGERLTGPPVWELEEKIVKGLPELPNKPMGGWTENPIRTFEALGESAKELFYRPIKEAEHRVTIERQATHKWIKETFKGVPGKSRRRIGAFAMAQQKRGKSILESMGVKEIPKLTKDEARVYNTLRKGFETYYQRLNEARKLSGKESFPKVENYFTFFRDLSLLEKMGFNPITTKSTMIQAQFQHLKTTPFRFAKARAKWGAMPVELDAMEIYRNYSEPAIRHIHMSPSIAKGREMLLTFGSKKTNTRWILKEEKPRTARFLTEWLDFQAGQRPVTNIPPIIEKAAMKLNQNIAFSLLSYNVRSALIQPSAFRNSIVEIGPKYLSRGIASLLDPKQRTFAMKESNVLLSRAYDVSATDAMQGIIKGNIGKAKRLAGSIGMKPLQYLDLETAKATWTGAYHKAREVLNYSHKKAVNYADDLVTKTQASAMPSDIAPIQRTALGKTVSSLGTFVLNEWGFITRDVLGIGNVKIDNVQAFKKTMSLIAATTLFNMVYEDLLGIDSPFPSPVTAYQEATERGDEWPSLSVAKEFAEQVPIVGGGMRYGTGALGATVGLVERIGRGQAKPEDAGMVFGIPGSRQVAKTIKAKNRGETPYGQIVGQYTKDKKLKTIKLKKMEKLKGL